MLVDDLVVMAAFSPTDSLDVDVLPLVAKCTTVVRPVDALYSVLKDGDKATDEYTSDCDERGRARGFLVSRILGFSSQLLLCLCAPVGHVEPAAPVRGGKIHMPASHQRVSMEMQKWFDRR